MPIVTGVGRVVEIAMNGLIASRGSNTVNTAFVFHFRRISILPAFSYANVEAAFGAAIGANIAAALNARWSGTVNVLRDIMDGTNAPVSIANADVGAIAGDSEPPNTAVYLAMKSGLRGKNFRGGKHFSPVSETDYTTATEDILNAGALARWTTVANAITSGFTDADLNVWVSCILSRNKSDLTTSPATVFVTDVVTTQVNQRKGRMNRREIKSVY